MNDDVTLAVVTFISYIVSSSTKKLLFHLKPVKMSVINIFYKSASIRLIIKYLYYRKYYIVPTVRYVSTV